MGQDLASQLDRAAAGAYLLPVVGVGEADEAALTRLRLSDLPFSVRINNAANYVGDVTDPASWTSAGVQIGRDLLGIASLVPEPPLVILADNNEGQKADYARAHPELMRLLHGALEAQLPPVWRQVVRHVGYNVGPVNHELGRGWLKETDLWMDVQQTWDGGSPPALYIHDWRKVENDLATLCPQFFAINIGYGRQFVNADWWQELSVWHGEQGTIDFVGLTPERYEGMALYGALAARPQVLREFLSSKIPYAQFQPFTEALYRVADRVNNDATVRRFWTDGELVLSSMASPLWRTKDGEPNPETRRIQLECDANPPMVRPDRPWSLDKAGPNIPVKALAYQIGDFEFLVFAQAPLGAQNVTVKVPGLGDVFFPSIPPEGVFHYADLHPDVPTEPAPWKSYEMLINGEIVPIKLRETEQ